MQRTAPKSIGGSWQEDSLHMVSIIARVVIFPV